MSEVLAAFDDVSAAISENHDLDSLLHLVAKHCCQLVPVKRCSVYLKDTRTGLFRGRVGHPLERNKDNLIKQLTAGIEADGFTREILQTKQPVLIFDTRSDPRPVRSTMLEWSVYRMLGVPMVRSGEVIGLLFLDNEDQPHEYTGEEQQMCSVFANLSAVAIGHAQLTTELRASLTTVERQNSLLRNAAAIEDRLAKLVLEGASLTEVIRAVAELTHKPAMLLDADLRPIALGNEPDSSNSQILGELLRRLGGDVTLLHAGDDGSGRRPWIVECDAIAGLRNRVIVAPVAVAGEIWAYVIALEHGRPIDARDRIITRRASTIIALSMSSERRMRESESRVRESFTRDLLAGSRNTPDLRRQAQYQQVDMDAPHAVCMFVAEDGGSIMPVSWVREALSNASSEEHPLVTTVDTGVGAIVRLPNTQDAGALGELRRSLEKAVASWAPERVVYVGVSRPATSPTRYPARYREAHEMLRCISTFAGTAGPRVLSALELGPARLLLPRISKDEADEFLEETLGDLVDPEMADLITTLNVFFESARSVRQSAEILKVHENTIRYRLAKVDEITGRDVSVDSDDQLAVQLALVILRVVRG